MTPIIPELAHQGLLLQAALPVGELDDDVRGALDPEIVARFAAGSLVLLGQAGTTFWDERVRARLDGRDPFDEASVAAVDEWFETRHPGEDRMIVYPGPAPIPLGRLAERAGWGRPSPLGLTITASHGPWIAHRVAFLTHLRFPAPTPAPEHPCDSCRDTDCVGACPVGAVSVAGGFDVEVCARHRAADHSVCAHQCLARNACPVGAEHRYGPDQMHHHYASGLASIRAWLDSLD